jgi:hypothetical protein
MFSKKPLTKDEQKLAGTLNAVERMGVKGLTESIVPDLDFQYSEKNGSTRIFAEIRMDSMSPELKSFALSALESSRTFDVEKTRDGSPYDCAIYEKTIKSRVGVTSESRDKFQREFRESIEFGIEQYASEVKKDLYGKGFPIKLPNPFSETKREGEGALAKFKSKMAAKEDNASPSLA